MKVDINIRRLFQKVRGTMKNDEKGFTLVEVIVAFGLFLMVVAISGSIMLFTANVSFRNAKINSAQQLGEAVYSSISNELKYAKQLEVKKSETLVNTLKYSKGLAIAGGKILHRKTITNTFESLYADDFYDSDTIDIIIKANDEYLKKGMMELTVRVYDKKGDFLYETGKVITIDNVAAKLAGTEYEIDSTTEELVNPLISYQ